MNEPCGVLWKFEVGAYVLVPHVPTRWERFKALFGYVPRKYDLCRVVDVATSTEGTDADAKK